MGLDGGGGGILGVSGSFTGPAEALELVGDHAYAMSGSIISAGGASADTTYLNFTSGNYYFVGTLSIYEKNAGNGERYADVSFNGANIIEMKADTNPDWLDNFPIPIIIPSYTAVEVTAGFSGGELFSVVLVGRIYRG